MKNTSFRFLGLIAVLPLFAGCGREPVASYPTPKEPAAAAPSVATAAPAPAPAVSAPPAGAGMDVIPVQAADGASLVWQAPTGWQSETGHPMRKASYAAGGGAEVAITAFPGDVGGILANVNRWRGQAGLEPVDEAGLARATSAIDGRGLHFVLVDAEGGAAPIVAALLPWNGGTWFFKLTGPAAAVAQAKPDFLSFLSTVRAP